MVTERSIKRKKQVLIDFGIPEESVDQLFKDKKFDSMRTLDCFANKILIKRLEK